VKDTPNAVHAQRDGYRPADALRQRFEPTVCESSLKKAPPYRHSELAGPDQERRGRARLVAVALAGSSGQSCFG
jgi:hypothetical protein